jgi:hypothetical protein
MEGLVERLSDYFVYSEEIAPLLRKAGLKAISGSFGNAYFSFSSAVQQEIMIQENNIYSKV